MELDVYHRPNLERAYKVRLSACSSFICFKMWDIRSFSRLESLTLTFTRHYSRYRGPRDSNQILYYLYTYFTQTQGFKSYVMYCTVLYCTVLYCTVPYCTVLYCTVLYRTVLYYT